MHTVIDGDFSHLPPSRRGVVVSLLISAITVGLTGVWLLSFSSADTASSAYSPPAAIPADCSRNVSSDLNSWLASVPDGSTVQFNGGCYRIDQDLRLTNRSSLTIDGGGATFKTDDPTGDSSSFDAAGYCATGSSATTPSKVARTRSQWDITGSSNITIRNMIIHGANPCGGTGSNAYVAPLEAQHAFNVDRNNTNITIEDVQAYDIYGDFIYFRGTTNGVARNNHFERNGRQGISVTGGGPTLIEGNTIANTRRATFDLEPNAASDLVDGVTIRGNTIGTGRLLFVASHGGGRVNNVLIERNTLSRCISVDVLGSVSLRRSNWTVQNNTTTGGCGAPAGNAAMKFGYVDHVWVLNNVQPIQANRGDYGVNITASSDVQVNNNSFINAVAALHPDSLSTDYSSCSNKLTSSGNYDQPIVCPVAPPPTTTTSTSTPPPASNGSTSTTGSSTASPTTGQSASRSAPTASRGTSSKPVSQPAGAATKPATVVKQVQQAPLKLADTAEDPTAPFIARIVAALKLFGVIVIAIVLVASVLRLLFRLLREFARHLSTRHFVAGAGVAPPVIIQAPSQALPPAPAPRPSAPHIRRDVR